ncbi:MAG: calcium-binding protein [Ilumatobacter sp.]|uniref:calcium-binding protein n=1 Tax=Ilumatobacter sp. TaxID=1967498 RepID=UPI00263636A8|nr:calcium-binding protein [Ilumatobacter sp.]MDJ0770869.1 calcium-binding protein [Ilumatobacter sp.]
MRSSSIPLFLLGFLTAIAVAPSAATAAGADDLSAATFLFTPPPGVVLFDDGNNAAATGETGEQLPSCHATDTQINSVWYSWQPPVGGTATIDTFGSAFDTVLAVYTGSAIGSLTEVVCNDDTGGVQSEVVFTATAYETYLIRIDGYNTASGNYVTYHRYVPDPMTNDDLVDATPLAGTVGMAGGHNFTATGESGEQLPTCHASDTHVNSVWYSWTAPGAGTATFETHSSQFDTVLTASTGTTIGALNEFVCNDDIGGMQSEITFATSAGQTYLIRVDGHLSSTGYIGLAWTFDYDPPINDDFTSPRNLYSVWGEIPGWTHAATAEPGEPLSSCNPGDPSLNSVWFTWTPGWSGPATIDTFGSDFDTVLDVFTGSSLASLSEIACNDDSGGAQSELTFPAVAGETYRIRIDGFLYDAGIYELHHHLDVPAPPNDHLTNAEILVGPAGSTFGLNAGATGEPGEQPTTCEPLDPLLSSVWFEWTAPGNGDVVFDTFGSTFDTVLAAHTGTSIGSLTELACNDDVGPTVQSEIVVTVISGETYRVSVDGFWTDVGDYQLNWQFLPAAVCDGLPVTVDIGLGQTPTMGPDVILGTAGADTIDALDGDDVICGLDGGDTIDGGDGRDTIFGDGGIDVIDGGRGNDHIYGGPDGDDIYGGGGGDRLWGEGGDDVVRGGNGNDRIYGGLGVDELRGQNGSDTVYANDDVDFTTADVDTVYGGGLYDDVFGDAGDDIVYGGNFADVLSGKSGDDMLYGNNGADTLRGGPHVLGDYCNGGVHNSGSGDTATACETVVNVP